MRLRRVRIGRIRWGKEWIISCETLDRTKCFLVARHVVVQRPNDFKQQGGRNLDPLHHPHRYAHELVAVLVDGRFRRHCAGEVEGELVRGMPYVEQVGVLARHLMIGHMDIEADVGITHKGPD